MEAKYSTFNFYKSVVETDDGKFFQICGNATSEGYRVVDATKHEFIIHHDHIKHFYSTNFSTKLEYIYDDGRGKDGGGILDVVYLEDVDDSNFRFKIVRCDAQVMNADTENNLTMILHFTNIPNLTTKIRTS